jgi:hypothetical protein
LTGHDPRPRRTDEGVGPSRCLTRDEAQAVTRKVPSAGPPPQLDEEIAGAEDPDTLDLREIDEMAVQADDPVRSPPIAAARTMSSAGSRATSPLASPARTRSATATTADTKACRFTLPE